MLYNSGKYLVWFEDEKGNQSNITLINVPPVKISGRIIGRNDTQMIELFTSRKPFKSLCKGKRPPKGKEIKWAKK